MLFFCVVRVIFSNRHVLYWLQISLTNLKFIRRTGGESSNGDLIETYGSGPFKMDKVTNLEISS